MLCYPSASDRPGDERGEFWALGQDRDAEVALQPLGCGGLSPLRFTCGHKDLTHSDLSLCWPW